MSVAWREAAHLEILAEALAETGLETQTPASRPLMLPAAISLPAPRVDRRKASWTPERRAQASQRMKEENWERFCAKWRPLLEET